MFDPNDCSSEPRLVFRLEKLGELGIPAALIEACYAAGTAESGDLTRIQDNAGNTRCFLTDALHRVIGIGPSSVPPCRRFSYDKTSNGVVPLPSGVIVNNAMGRLVEAETDNCGNWPPIPITDEWFSYTARRDGSHL